MDADRRRRSHNRGGIFSLSTPLSSASAASSSSPRRRNNNGNRSTSSAPCDGVGDMDDMEFRVCRPEEGHVLSTAPSAREFGPIMNFDVTNDDAPSNNETNNDNDPAAGPKAPVPASEPQLKSPPELLATSKSPSPLQSRWVPPAAVSDKAPAPYLSRLHANLADPNSWIDALKKKTAGSVSSQIKASEDAANATVPHYPKEADRCVASRGGVVISNLEESYFRKPAPNRCAGSPDPNKREGIDEKIVIKSSTSPTLEEDERSEATQRHSNKSNKRVSDHDSNDPRIKKKMATPQSKGIDEKVSKPLMPPTLGDDACPETTQCRSNKINIRESQPSAKKDEADSNNNRPKSGRTTDLPEDNSKASGGEDEAGDVDVELARAKAESKKLLEESRKAEEARFQADLERAMSESIRQQKIAREISSPAIDVVELMDSGDEEDSKFHAAAGTNASGIPDDEDAQLKEAMRLSLEESKKPKLQPSALPEEQELEFRKLNRNEFEQVVDAFVAEQGGYEKIEGGQMVKHGNANDMKKSCVADGGGQNQTGAQYGRYSIRRLWRLFDVLEGRDGVDVDESDVVALQGDPKPAADRRGVNVVKREREENSRLDGLPGAEIKAFVDIGHGIGIQVLQAGWAHGVRARGVEIMKDRHVIAQAVEAGVLESLRTNPPDATKVQLRLADFSRAIIRDKKTYKRDEELRQFLLFHDESDEVQEGLVIFINNAEEVFAARSNQKNGGACLDAYLAILFANMRIGGRMVTLTDVSCHLTQSSEWFRRDVFQSGTNAVSWGNSNKSIDVHVLTKLSNGWYCRNNKCDSKKCDPPLSNPVVDENTGDLCEHCDICGAQAKRCSRFRKPSAKRRRGEK